MRMKKKSNGMALRGYMAARGMRRQRELAQALGISDAMLSLYFHGKKSFGARTALRIARLTGIPMERLYQ